jgi:hypothetical protein
VRLDEDLVHLIIQQGDWRWKIMQGPRVQQVIEVIRSAGYVFPEGGEFGLTKAELIRHGVAMQLSATLVHEITLDAAKLGYIKIRGTKICMEAGALLESPVMQRAIAAGVIKPQKTTINAATH